MAGSKKGERRGNARKRHGTNPGWRRSHETPGEIMEEALRQSGKHTHLHPPVIERRIQVARIILGHSGAVEDITPKEALLMGMRHGLQAIRDYTDMLEQLSALKPSKRVTRQIEELEIEIERQYNVMGEFAFKVAGYIHPKLQATHTTVDMGQNQASILQELADEIDRRQREEPIPIEHKPKLLGSP